MTAILSDIHGNLPALESVLEDMAQYDIDQVISLGDVSGYYPFINEVIELLRSHQAINLIGNHDRYIIDNTECPRSTSANLCLTYQKSVITDKNREWLAKSSSSPLIFEDASMVHGGWDDPEDEYLYKINTAYLKDLMRNFSSAVTPMYKSISILKMVSFLLIPVLWVNHETVLAVQHIVFLTRKTAL